MVTAARCESHCRGRQRGGELVSFEYNLSRADGVGVALQNSTDSAIVGNEVIASRFHSIGIGGANGGLVIRGNEANQGSGVGIRFVRSLIDRFPVPSEQVVLEENDVRSMASAGILVATNNLIDSLIANNTIMGNSANGISFNGGFINNEVVSNEISENGFTGVFLSAIGANSTGNELTDNDVNGNGRNGISVASGGTGNRF